MGNPLSRTSIADEVFAHLREAILSGRYAPGERLPTQRTLAADLQVNIATVREALGRLEQLRLVEIRHGDATRVLDWRRSGGLEAVALLASTMQQVVGPLFEARRLLLVEAARLAAERREDGQAQGIEELSRGVAGACDDQTALICDWQFMSAIVDAAGNLIFQLIMNSVRELYLPRAGEFGALLADRRALAPLYARAAAAIRAGEPGEAAHAIGELTAAQEASMLESIS